MTKHVQDVLPFKLITVLCRGHASCMNLHCLSSPISSILTNILFGLNYSPGPVRTQLLSHSGHRLYDFPRRRRLGIGDECVRLP